MEKSAGPDANPTIRIKVRVVELGDRDRLVARVTFSSGGEGDVPIDVQGDLWNAAIAHGYSREQIVYGVGAWELLQKLPDSR